MPKPKPVERLVAEAAGLTTYYGAPCPKGHTRRYTGNGACTECAIARTKRNVQKNPEARRDYSRLHYERHRDTYCSRAADWRMRNPDQFKQSLKDWSRHNPEKVRTGRRNRKARKRGAAGYHTAADSRLILRLQGGCCAYCGETTNLHLDHVIPLARGGSNWPWNLQWLCAFHNMSKGAMTDEEYREKINLNASVPISKIYWFSVVLYPLLFP